MLGQLRACHTARTINRFSTQKTGLLLAYLAYYRKRVHPREELAELFWPDSDVEACRTNLRVALLSLHRQLEPPGTPAGSVLMCQRTCVQLNPQVITTDVADFEAALQAAWLEDDPIQQAHYLSEALNLYRGVLLPGFYEEWVLTERDRLADAHVGALKQLIAILEKAGDLNRAVEYAHQAVVADPLREEIHLDLMRLYAATGRPAAALRQYQELERLLREELKEEPSEEARVFVERLQKRRYVAAMHRRRTIQSQSDSRNRGDSVALPWPQPQRLRESPRPPVAAPPPQDNGSRNPSLAGKKAVGRQHGTQDNGLPNTSSPRSAEAPSLRLPMQFTRFFGREEEIARLQELVNGERADDHSRLITLTGPGGSGKTRLAIECVRQAASVRAGAVWFVPLADLIDARLIPAAILGTLCPNTSTRSEALEEVVAALANRPTLLILDNFEHLVESGAALVKTLLECVPTLTCLVTSRQRLGLEGEQEFPVAPLPTPSAPGTPERLLEFASVQLFVDRAQLTRPDFQVTARNAADVAALCDRLEGIPLAIELAAPWIQSLTPAQILSRIERRFDLLVSRRRDIGPRHVTLRAALEWSYRLLSPELQRFFARLSVFRGGWTLETAEAVCGNAEVWEYGSQAPTQPPSHTSTPHLLARLQAHSLVVAEEAEGGMRYRLLETLREYANEQLSAAERERLARRHAAYYLELAENTKAKGAGAEQAEGLARLEEEHDNFRAALEWALASEPEIALRLTVALWRFWYVRGYLNEGRRWLEEALSRSEDGPESIRARSMRRAWWLEARGTMRRRGVSTRRVFRYAAGPATGRGSPLRSIILASRCAPSRTLRRPARVVRRLWRSIESRATRRALPPR